MDKVMKKSRFIGLFSKVGRICVVYWHFIKEVTMIHFEPMKEKCIRSGSMLATSCDLEQAADDRMKYRLGLCTALEKNYIRTHKFPVFPNLFSTNRHALYILASPLKQSKRPIWIDKNTERAHPKPPKSHRSNIFLFVWAAGN